MTRLFPILLTFLSTVLLAMTIPVESIPRSSGSSIEQTQGSATPNLNEDLSNIKELGNPQQLEALHSNLFEKLKDRLIDLENSLKEEAAEQIKNGKLDLSEINNVLSIDVNQDQRIASKLEINADVKENTVSSVQDTSNERNQKEDILETPMKNYDDGIYKAVEDNTEVGPESPKSEKSQSRSKYIKISHGFDQLFTAIVTGAILLFFYFSLIKLNKYQRILKKMDSNGEDGEAISLDRKID